MSRFRGANFNPHPFQDEWLCFIFKDNTYWSHLSMNITMGRAHANNSVTQKYL